MAKADSDTCQLPVTFPELTQAVRQTKREKAGVRPKVTRTIPLELTTGYQVTTVEPSEGPR